MKPAAISSLLAPALLALATACAPMPPRAPAPHPAEPPPVAEIRPRPPVSYRALVWQPGHHDWDGGGYRWVPGRYIDRTAAGGLWQPGFWTYRGAPPNGGWTWLAAHWR